MSRVRSVLATAVGCAVIATALLTAAQKSDKPSKEQEARRPKVSLRAQPQVAVAPAHVTLTAELTGGSDDFEEYYCPSIEWEWGDDTKSESTTDCEPYESGKSQIKRRYTTQHQFPRPGSYRVYIHLKQRDKILASANAMVQVQPGLGGL
jgi:hypothetical protein